MHRRKSDWVGTDQTVTFLRDTRAYPEQPANVEVIETHKSWVFLTDRYAYKLKKPIRYNSVDFRTSRARCKDCETEVLLNNRLAEGVYLGVETMTQDEHGALVLGGEGSPIDCLVKMKRLPDDRMLSRLIKYGKIRAEEVQKVALKLARFYRVSPSILTNPDEYRNHLLSEINASFDALSEPDHGVDLDLIRHLKESQLRFVDHQFNLLNGRITAGRIIDGHGDLRAEHVCVLDEPVIFDCLEFDARLRIVDPIDELAFLALECERLGDASIGAILFATYEAMTRDSVTPELVAFYKVYRATMWARLAIWRTHELALDDWGKWIDRANTYLHFAERYQQLVDASRAEDTP